MSEPTPREKRRLALIAVGQECYGDRWQAAVARDLAVRQPTVAGMASDRRPVPEYVLPRLAYVWRVRAQFCANLANGLKGKKVDDG